MVGIGVDLVDISRIEAALDRGERFAERVFARTERRTAAARRFPARYLAACFAAKEAFLKALGRGLFEGIPLRQIEVAEAADGRVELRLGPLAGQALARAGGRDTLVGLSRDRGVAVAVVVVQ